jgi:hypothetical protein
MTMKVAPAPSTRGYAESLPPEEGAVKSRETTPKVGEAGIGSAGIRLFANGDRPVGLCPGGDVWLLL